jgi:hypothetical protein
VADAIGGCVEKSRGGLAIAAAAIEPTHMHLAIRYPGRDIDVTAKWLADQTAKAVHRETSHTGPVWCKGRWRAFIFQEEQWQVTLRYLERHNLRHGRPARRPGRWGRRGSGGRTARRFLLA